jgi:soluble lytic murein transglycosylase-like protein
MRTAPTRFAPIAASLRLGPVLLVLLLADGAGAAEQSKGLRTWEDAEGVVHLTNGPSAAARRRASREVVVPKSTRQRSRVRETSAFDDTIAAQARKYSLPQELVRAVIVAESNFDPEAISPAGARGLMQLMPGTAAAMYVQDIDDPVENIRGGTRYLRILANQFGGDLVKTIAAYNAGPGAVQKAGGIPKFEETQGYVERVMKLYRIYRGVRD